MLPSLVHCSIAALVIASTTTASTGHAGNITIDVVVLPHSHDDAGWQRTFEGYYKVETRNILDNVVAWLSANPAAKFIWVETSFLQRWWLDANVSSQQAFKDHLASGRLELVGGGWTMHDEESTNPYSAMSNMEYGLTWLSDTFGPQYRPRVLWQIDPSGHSVFTPTLSAALGYDLLVLDRVPDPVRQAMRQDQGLQFVWTAVNSSQYIAGTSILSFVLEEFYCSPNLGSGDVASQAAQFYTDVLRRSAWLKASEAGRMTILWPWGCDFAFQQYSDFTLMENVLSYMASNASAFPGVSARLGTLSDYLASLHAQEIAFPTMGTRDFHPYIWCYEPSNWDLCYNLPTTPDGAYWRTGMYTSKVGLKGLSRVLDAAQHAAEVLLVQARVEQSAGSARMQQRAAQASLRGSLPAPADGHSFALRDNSTWLPAVGNARATGALMTHHDAITGTAYISCSLGPPYDDCNCFQDYMDRMSGAVGGAAAAAGDMAGFLLAKAGVPAQQRPSFGNATLAAASLTPSTALMLSVSNPLGWARREIVRLSLAPATSLTLQVVDMRTQGTEQSQVVVDTLRNSSTLYFMADVPALSTVVYSVTATTGASAPPVPAPSLGQGVTLDNGAMAITYDTSGRIVSWRNHSSGLTLPLQHAFWLYPEKLAGGDLIGGTVYGFEPLADKEPQLVGPGVNGTGDIPLTVLANGPLVWEVVQSVSPFLLHSVRMFAPAAAPTRAPDGYAAAPPLAYTLEWQTQVLTLPFSNGTGGSLVSAFAPGAGCTFLPSATAPASPYSALTSDASGFQVLRRPPYNLSQYAQGQVYPAWPGWDWVHGPCDGSAPPGGSPSLLSLSMQRPTGTAVMSNTSLWTMLHRRLVNPSDDRGNDVTVIDDVIALGLADPTSQWQAEAEGGVRMARQVQGRLLAHPLQLAGALYASPAEYTAVGNAAYRPPWLAGSLPPGVHLHSTVSRERWYPSAPNSTTSPSPPPARHGAHSGAGVQLGMRLQQLPYAPAVTFDAAALLSGGGYTLASWQETTPDFTADKAVSDARRRRWRTVQREGESEEIRGMPPAGTPTAVSFDAEYVRSYLLELQAPA